MNTERREELRVVIKMIEDAITACQTTDPTFDPLEGARCYLSDAISDIDAEVDRLTDEIGDERGDNYPVERSMLAFRQIGL